jgi:ATP-dependent Clp protease ATP-binding subunit ClpA
LQHEVETALARRVLTGEIPDGGEVTVDVDGGKLAFRVRQPSAETAGAS